MNANSRRDKSVNADYTGGPSKSYLAAKGTSPQVFGGKKPNTRSNSEPPGKVGPHQQQPPVAENQGEPGESREGQERDKPKIVNIITKFSFATKGGISAHNPYKVNQDAYITNPHIMGLKHCHFFSVCDGHGSNGREVSSFLKHRLPIFIEAQLKA